MTEVFDGSVLEIAGRRVLSLAPEGPKIAAERDVSDLLGAAWSARADWVAAPVPRLDRSFFQLRSGLAGAVLQKLANYRMPLAIVGDVSGHARASRAFHDLVVEADQGEQLWFVADLAELELRLNERGPGA